MAVLELLTVAVPLVAAVVRRRAKRAVAVPVPELPQAPAPKGGSAADRVAGPAYPYLRAWSPELRALLVQVADELKLNPVALATVFALESGGDPSEPKEPNGTPRAGLIQVTVGARLEGLRTADAVWAVRSWSAERQLREVVFPFFVRQKGRSPGWTAFQLYQRNFLPADVGKPDTFKLGEKGSSEPLVKGSKVTRGAVYEANKGAFDREGKGYFTWADVRAKVEAKEREAGGEVVTVAGKVLPAAAAATTRPAPGTVTPATTAASSAPPKEPPSAVAPAIRQLLKQVNAGWPNRTRASDGTLGDAAHNARCKGADAASGLCDHSTGRALDITLDPERGPNLDALAEALLKDPRCRYVIWKARIANPAIAGGAWRPYTGSNPHTRHLHVSVLEEMRNDARPWNLPGAGAVAASSTPAAAGVAPASAIAGELPGLVRAWGDGLIDNVFFFWIRVGSFEIQVATDSLSVAGQRLPFSFAEELELARKSTLLPPTKAVADARWAAATRKVVLSPLGPPDDPATVAKWGKLPGQVREWNKRIGPKAGAGELLDGPLKHWLLTADLKRGGAVNYGFRREGGAVWQSPGRRHDDHYKGDPTQQFAPMARAAFRDGKEVDLVEELARGAPELLEGGPLPAWLVEVLR